MNTPQDKHINNREATNMDTRSNLKGPERQANNISLKGIRDEIREMGQLFGNNPPRVPISSPEILDQLSRRQASSPRNVSAFNDESIAPNSSYIPNVVGHQEPNTNRVEGDSSNRNQQNRGRQNSFNQPNQLNPFMNDMQNASPFNENTQQQFLNQFSQQLPNQLMNQMFHQFNQFNPINQMMGQLMSQYMHPYMQFNQNPFWPNPVNHFQNVQNEPQRSGHYNLPPGAQETQCGDAIRANMTPSATHNVNQHNENSNNVGISNSNRIKNTQCRESFMKYLDNIPLFSGQSREDLMNFVEICDTINSFATNESEYVEFITKVTFQLRGEARSVLSDDIEWVNIKERLLCKFSYLSNRSILDSQIENLRQEKDESLVKYAERARKLLIEKNKSFYSLTEEQRAEHDRIARKFFTRGILNQRLRDTLVVQASLSLEESIGRSLEVENEISTFASKREFYCKYCNKIGHREVECKTKENNDTPLGQLTSALRGLTMRGSNNGFTGNTNGNYSAFNRNNRNFRQNDSGWNNNQNFRQNNAGWNNNRGASSNDGSSRFNGGSQFNSTGQSTGGSYRNNGNNNNGNNSNNFGTARGGSNGQNGTNNSGKFNNTGGNNNNNRGYNNNDARNVRFLSRPDEVGDGIRPYAYSYKGSEN